MTGPFRTEMSRFQSLYFEIKVSTLFFFFKKKKRFSFFGKIIKLKYWKPSKSPVIATQKYVDLLNEMKGYLT